ncbi:MAG: hypothetical protein IPK07_18120 [Deltaproteobacteria bacterium]|nr:hypothetical protein [Deltaproteobacteria bacterium]
MTILVLAAAPSRADYVTTAVPPASVSANLGTTGSQPIGVLATQDLSGDTTDLARAQRYTPGPSGYQGIFSFVVPAGLDVATASGLSLAASYYGQPKSCQRWTFQVRDYAASSWLTLGYNDGASYHHWKPLSFPLSGDLSRFVSASRVMQVRYTTYSAADSSDLDWLVFQVTTYVPPTTEANPQIPVGPGFTDVSPHQVVRTLGNVVYTVAPDCTSYPECPNSAIHVRKANQPGTPTSFTELDAAHAPGGGVGQPAVGLDGQGRIHVIWNKRSGYTKYATFDTSTGLWSSSESLGASGWTDFTQGEEGTALAIDAAGIPHAVWSARTGPNSRLRLKYARRLATGWEAPIDVADVVDCNPASDYCNAWHPDARVRGERRPLPGVAQRHLRLPERRAHPGAEAPRERHLAAVGGDPGHRADRDRPGTVDDRDRGRCRPPHVLRRRQPHPLLVPGRERLARRSAAGLAGHPQPGARTGRCGWRPDLRPRHAGADRLEGRAPSRPRIGPERELARTSPARSPRSHPLPGGLTPSPTHPTAARVGPIGWRAALRRGRGTDRSVSSPAFHRHDHPARTHSREGSRPPLHTQRPLAWGRSAGGPRSVAAEDRTGA